MLSLNAQIKSARGPISPMDVLDIKRRKEVLGEKYILLKKYPPRCVHCITEQG